MAVKFNLGERVRDTITGIEGVIICYMFHLNGCQYIEVEPDASDGKLAECLYLPEERFEIVPGHPAPVVKTPDISDCHIKLGSMVKDMVSGFTGIAAVIQIPLFGAGRINIEPPIDKDGKIPDSYSFDEMRVELIEEKAPPMAEAMPETRKSRGCAPANANRYSLR